MKERKNREVTEMTNILVTVENGKTIKKEYKTMKGLQDAAKRAIKRNADVIIKKDIYDVVSIYNSRTGMFVKAK